MPDTFNEDPVRVKLAGQEIPIAERYTVRCGVLEVPAQFQITVGHGGMFRELAAQFPPLTPFELWIGDKLVQVGETDGYARPNDDGTMTIDGRDSLARLHDEEITDERTFAEKTYADLTRMALKECGLGDRTLFSLNSANLKAITGKEAVQIEKRKQVSDQTPTGLSDAGDLSTIEVTRTLKGEVGVRWLEFLLKEYRKAGLFLWSDHNGNFVLSQPNGSQKPLYRILNRRGSQSNEVSITGCQFHNDTKDRPSEVIVTARAGRGKHGRGVILERFIDEEMVALLNPDPADRKDGGKRKRIRMLHDQHVQTPAQARLFARRKVCEARRAAWRLIYKVSGHSTPAIGGGRAVWAPDTTVEVVDDELGLEGIMYVESVTYSRNTQTECELHIMRIEDLLFAEELPEAVKKRPKLQVRRGVTTVDRPSHVLQGVTVDGVAVSKKAVWTTDPNVAVGAKVIIDPDKEVNLDQKANVTLKPLVFGSQADVGVAADDANPQQGWPTKPTP